MLGTFGKTVTKKTDILVCSDPDAASSKLEKARKNGTQIVGPGNSYDKIDIWDTFSFHQCFQDLRYWLTNFEIVGTDVT